MAVNTQELIVLYVATFKRAPDAAGLDYWSTYVRRSYIREFTKKL